MGKDKSETLFGSAESTVEQTKKSLIARRIAENNTKANKNKVTKKSLKKPITNHSSFERRG